MVRARLAKENLRNCEGGWYPPCVFLYWEQPTPPGHVVSLHHKGRVLRIEAYVSVPVFARAGSVLPAFLQELLFFDWRVISHWLLWIFWRAYFCIMSNVIFVVSRSSGSWPMAGVARKRPEAAVAPPSPSTENGACSASVEDLYGSGAAKLKAPRHVEPSSEPGVAPRRPGQALRVGDLDAGEAV